MTSGLIGGLPVTQVIVRSSANIQSGGRTKLSAILHGILLLLCVVAIPSVINLIPLAVLASILIMVGYKLAKPVLFIEMYKLGWAQFIPFIVTVVGIVFTDLLMGIGLGLVVGFFIIIRNSYRNSHFLHKEDTEQPTKIKMTLAEEVTFLNKGAILKELKRIPNGSTVTIDATQSQSIDYDVLEIIENFKITSTNKNISVEFITKNKKEEFTKLEI
jgi:MFS superfamily sulfate permease-like transporter